MFEILKAILFGIVEGITEWLPVSSTGHLILLNEFLTLDVSESFQKMFDVVIQLGAIVAVIVLFFNKLNPFSPKKSPARKKQTWELWFKVCVAIIPSGVIGILFDDLLEQYLHGGIPVAIALIVYGIAFILVERRNAGKTPAIKDVYDIDYKTAILIGCFQCLSLWPGTSREEINKPVIEPENIDDWIYTVEEDGTITLNGYKGTETEVVIPNYINGMPVKKLAHISHGHIGKTGTFWHRDICTNESMPTGYFYFQRTITKVVISEGIEEVEYMTFYFSKALEEIVLPKSLISISVNNDFYGCDVITVKVPWKENEVPESWNLDDLTVIYAE